MTRKEPRSTWACEVTGPVSRADLPEGADYPMRQAVRRAFKEVTGVDEERLSSGWGLRLEPIEAETSRPPVSGDALDVLAEVLDAVDALPAEHEAWGFRDEANRMLGALRERGWTLAATPPERRGLDVDDLAAFFHEEYWSEANEPHLAPRKGRRYRLRSLLSSGGEDTP